MVPLGVYKISSSGGRGQSWRRVSLLHPPEGFDGAGFTYQGSYFEIIASMS